MLCVLTITLGGTRSAGVPAASGVGSVRALLVVSGSAPGPMVVTPNPATTGPAALATTIAPEAGGTTTAVPFPKSVVSFGGATFVARHPTLPVYYLTQELGRPGKAVIAVRRSDAGRWSTVSRITVGEAPVHIIVDHAGKYAYVASYNGASVTQIALSPNGTFGRAVTLVMPEGTGPDQDRQTRPHPHSTAVSPDGSHIVVADLGSDSLHVISTSTMQIGSTVRLPAGAGPRTAVFTDPTTVVVSEELGHAVSFWTFDATTGLVLRNRLTLDAGSTPSDIVVRPKATGTAPVLLVIERGPNLLTEVTGATLGRRWSVPGCGARHGIWLDQSTLALACTKAGEVRVLRFAGDQMTVVATSPVARAAALQPAI